MQPEKREKMTEEISLFRTLLTTLDTTRRTEKVMSIGGPVGRAVQLSLQPSGAGLGWVPTLHNTNYATAGIGKKNQ